MAQVWTLGALVRAITGHLAAHKIESARLDAELMVCAVHKVSRTHLYINEHEELSEEELGELRLLTKRRAKHEPMAYILGEREFYGNTIFVGPGVLVPRPETELLVDVALSYLQAVMPKRPRILDLCCGSGAIAIAIANAWPDCTLVGADISPEALTMAQRSVAHHDLTERIELVESDLFAGRTDAAKRALDGPFDIVISNPPYVRSDERDALPPTVRDFEPHGALFAGADGLDVLRRIAKGVKARMGRDKLVAVEMGHQHADAVAGLFGPLWPELRVLNDLSGIPRVVTVWEGAEFSGDISLTGQAQQIPGRGKARLERQQALRASANQSEQSQDDEHVFHVDQAPTRIVSSSNA